MINITQGNDETLFVTFTRGGEAYRFDKVTKARLVSDYGRAYGMAFTEGGGGLLIQLPHTMPPGCYGLEVCGTEGTLERRTASKNILRVTNLTERGDCRIEAGCDDYDIAISVSLMEGLADGNAAENISTARFLVALRDGTLDESTLYSVGQPSQDGMTGVALYKGKRHVGGLDTNGMRDLKVAWEDKAMRAAALLADGLYADANDEEKESLHGPYTYGELIDMDDDAFAEMMHYYRCLAKYSVNGQAKTKDASSFCRVRALPELELCRGVKTMPGDGNGREGAFDGCFLLTSVPLAGQLTEIKDGVSADPFGYYGDLIFGTGAFHNCTSLTKVELPLCTTVGVSAFRECASLKTVSLPKCTTVGAYAFSGIGGMGVDSISLPECTNLAENALKGASIKKAYFPKMENVGNMDEFTMSGIFHVTEELVLGATPPIGSSMQVQDGCTVYVPDDAVATYQADDNWKSKNIKPLSQRPAE